MKRRTGVLALATLAVAAFETFAACSSPTHHPGPLGDPVPTGTSTAKPPVKDASSDIQIGDAGPCDPLPLPGGYITQTEATGTPPALAGGTITDGFYYATSARNYSTGLSPATFHESVLVRSGVLHFTAQFQGDSVTVSTYSYIFVTPDGGDAGAPTQIQLTSLCTTGSAPAVLDYEATATTLTVMGPKGTGYNVELYTRQ